MKRLINLFKLKLSFFCEDNRLLGYLIGFPVTYFDILRALKKKTVGDALDFVFSSVFLGVQQNRSEFEKLLSLVRELKPRVVMEIGTYRGGTLFLFSRVIPEYGLIVSLDLPRDSAHNGYARWRSFLYRNYVQDKRRIEIIQQDSHLKQTKEMVDAFLGGRAVDFLFIDADHRYEGVKLDFEMYFPLVSHNGVVALHDIIRDKNSLENGVYFFWEEVKKKDGQIREFVESREQQGKGIGLFLRTPPNRLDPE